ncbi:P27 family phage terminase small subunit [uncultured Parolsenella sp.]|uniref:P27 family phage terminase small subunit n=1 Tax=uncultured Parolsenella sp. TaxID=2083008 RepID=UPI0027D95C5E|nr:P27 family phage terminase small subunit [uncultured Parolsenella sp.]
MSRGRKPDALAVRRGGSTADAAVAEPVGAVVAAPADGVAKPPSVSASGSMSALWDQLVGTGRAFKPQDAPYLEQLVFDLETVRQCRDNLLDADGNVRVLVGRGEPLEDGTYLDYRESPYLAVMDKAASRAMKLADALGLTPLARARLGLTQASAVATVSIADQIFAAMRGSAR